MGADAFREALGSGRGPSAQQLAEELRQVREENDALRDAGAAQDLAASRMSAAVERMEGELRDALTDNARNERELRTLTHMLQAAQYLALHHLDGSPADRALVWYDAAGFASYPFYRFRPEFHGDFSHRRPYLRTQFVRDGKHGYFVALNPLPPSRTRPHADPPHWEPCEPAEHELVFESRMREVSVILRRAPAAPRNDSCERLKDALKNLREQAPFCWETEIGNRENFLPCPAHAYRSWRPWLEDLPGFRTRAAELRRRQHKGPDPSEGVRPSMQEVVEGSLGMRSPTKA